MGIILDCCEPRFQIKIVNRPIKMKIMTKDELNLKLKLNKKNS